MKLFDPSCIPLKSVPPGKAVWNANGGFVSVLLTHLLLLLIEAYTAFLSNVMNVSEQSTTEQVATSM